MPDRSHRALKRTREHHKKYRIQPCWRCSLDVNYDAPDNAPDAYRLGHRQSLASGGHLTDPTNLAPEHHLCNHEAGPSNQRPLGTPSRQW